MAQRDTRDFLFGAGRDTLSAFLDVFKTTQGVPTRQRLQNAPGDQARQEGAVDRDFGESDRVLDVRRQPAATASFSLPQSVVTIVIVSALVAGGVLVFRASR